MNICAQCDGCLLYTSVSRTEDNPWPEWPKVLKTDYGQEEAAAVFGKDPRVYQTTVQEFIMGKEGQVVQVRTVKLRPEKDKETGKTRMAAVPDSEEVIPADLVLIACLLYTSGSPSRPQVQAASQRAGHTLDVNSGKQ